MSKFVSGGTIDKPIERDDEWRKAQEEVEAAHLRKLKENEQQDGRSLYEVLQANKAAKQDAFEESIRLKNQFRSLDDDEIDFLDKVLESTRAKEAAVKRETSEQLDYFRRQQEEAEKAAQAQNTDAVVPEVEEKWATGRKRKKGKEGEGAIKGLKLRKTSSVGSPPGPSGALSTGGTNEPTQAARAAVDTQEKSASPQAAKAAAPTKASPVPSMGLGLGDYSSDED